MFPPYEKVRKGKLRRQGPVLAEDAVNDRFVRKFDGLEKGEPRNRRHVSIQAESRLFVKERGRGQRLGEKGQKKEHSRRNRTNRI
jgi:hypothetical protein